MKFHINISISYYLINIVFENVPNIPDMLTHTYTHMHTQPHTHTV